MEDQYFVGQRDLQTCAFVLVTSNSEQQSLIIVASIPLEMGMEQKLSNNPGVQGSLIVTSPGTSHLQQWSTRTVEISSRKCQGFDWRGPSN